MVSFNDVPDTALKPNEDIGQQLERGCVVKNPYIVLAGIVIIGISLYLFVHMIRSDATTKEQLPEFALTPTDYGWTGKFPGGPWQIFGKEISVQIDTRMVPNKPQVLPQVSASQAALVHTIAPALPAIIGRVEQEMVKYNDHERGFREFVRNPQIWLSSEKDDGKTWAFVIERTDNPDFGYHAEFKGTKFIEIWAGD